jgi:hypothetical protein
VSAPLCAFHALAVIPRGEPRGPQPDHELLVRATEEKATEIGVSRPEVAVEEAFEQRLGSLFFERGCGLPADAPVRRLVRGDLEGAARRSSCSGRNQSDKTTGNPDGVFAASRMGIRASARNSRTWLSLHGPERRIGDEGVDVMAGARNQVRSATR